MRDIFLLTARLLLAASVAEFLLVRTGLRLGPMLPEGPGVTAIMGWAFQAAMVALNLTVVLGLATLAMLTTQALRAGGPRGATLAVAAGGAAALALAGLAVPSLGLGAASPWLLVATSLGSLAVMLAGLVASPTDARGRLALGSICAVYAAVHYQYVARTGPALGIPLGGVAPSLALAEALAVVVVGPALLFAFRPGWRPSAAVVAGLVAALVAGFYLARGPIAAALAMWNLGFTSFLPPYAYPIAVGVYLYSVVALYQRPAARQTAIGLGLIALGGLRLDNTYFSLLSYCGFLLVAASPLLTGRPEPAQTVLPRKDAADPAGATVPLAGVAPGHPMSPRAAG